MKILRDIKKLFIYHDTTRLLIKDLELRHTQLLIRIQALEERQYEDLNNRK